MAPAAQLAHHCPGTTACTRHMLLLATMGGGEVHDLLVCAREPCPLRHTLPYSGQGTMATAYTHTHTNTRTHTTTMQQCLKLHLTCLTDACMEWTHTHTHSEAPSWRSGALCGGHLWGGSVVSNQHLTQLVLDLGHGDALQSTAEFKGSETDMQELQDLCMDSVCKYLAKLVLDLGHMGMPCTVQRNLNRQGPIQTYQQELHGSDMEPAKKECKSVSHVEKR